MLHKASTCLHSSTRPPHGPCQPCGRQAQWGPGRWMQRRLATAGPQPTHRTGAGCNSARGGALQNESDGRRNGFASAGHDCGPPVRLCSRGFSNDRGVLGFVECWPNTLVETASAFGNASGFRYVCSARSTAVRAWIRVVSNNGTGPSPSLSSRPSSVQPRMTPSAPCCAS